MFSVHALRAELERLDQRAKGLAIRPEVETYSYAFFQGRAVAENAIESLTRFGDESIDMAEQEQALDFMRCRLAIGRCQALICLMESPTGFAEGDWRFWHVRRERVVMRWVSANISSLRAWVLRYRTGYQSPPLVDSIRIAIAATDAYSKHKKKLKLLLSGS